MAQFLNITQCIAISVGTRTLSTFLNLTLDYCSENERLRIFLKEIFSFPQ